MNINGDGKETQFRLRYVADTARSEGAGFLCCAPRGSKNFLSGIFSGFLSGSWEKTEKVAFLSKTQLHEIFDKRSKPGASPLDIENASEAGRVLAIIQLM